MRTKSVKKEAVRNLVLSAGENRIELGSALLVVESERDWDIVRLLPTKKNVPEKFVQSAETLRFETEVYIGECVAIDSGTLRLKGDAQKR